MIRMMLSVAAFLFFIVASYVLTGMQYVAQNGDRTYDESPAIDPDRERARNIPRASIRPVPLKVGIDCAPGTQAE